MSSFDDTFQVTYPCWLLVHESSIISTGKEKGKLADKVFPMTVLDGSQQKSLPVFTDQDLASRFMDASDGMEDEVAISANTQELLVAFLEMVRGEVDNVVFDPPKAVGWSLRVWPLEYVIEHLRNG